MGWVWKGLLVVGLMFGTDVLWLTWGLWQRYKVKQMRRVLAAGRVKKKRVRLVPVRMPTRHG